MSEFKKPDYPTLEELKSGSKKVASAALIASMLFATSCGGDKEETTTTEWVLDGETETYILQGEEAIETSAKLTTTTETTEFVLAGDVEAVIEE